MVEIRIVTKDGYRFESIDDYQACSFDYGGYRRIGAHEYFYFTDKVAISEEDKLLCENRVREIQRKVDMLKEV